MTSEEKFKEILRQANSGQNLMFDSMVEEIWPKVKEALVETIPKNYDFTWDRPFNEYPLPIYNVIGWSIMRPIVLNYLEESHPEAWFKPMFFSEEKLEEFIPKKD